MKTLLMSTLLMLSVDVFAATTKIISCGPETVLPDQGFSVTIYQKRKKYFAVVTESTIAGPQERMKRWVTPEQNLPIGSPMIYSGKEISISIQMTTTPRPDRKHRGGLEAVDDKGREIHEKLLCQTHSR